MGCRLLCSVALCLLGAVPMDTGITQTPKHLVTGPGRRVTLKCEQYLGHDAVYWYQQSAQKPPKLMFAYSYKELLVNETALVASHLSAQTAPGSTFTWTPWSPMTLPCISVLAAETQPHTANLSLCTNILGLAGGPWGNKTSSTSPVGPQTEIPEPHAACALRGRCSAECPAQTPTAWGLAQPSSSLCPAACKPEGPAPVAPSSLQEAHGPGECFRGHFTLWPQQCCHDPCL
ncbi:T cell receptor beta variable 3-1 [Vulpes lagopus]